MGVFLTADTHFFHRNIIKFCTRPFNDVKHMNDTIVANWNKVVKPNDTVYHLGDFALTNDTNSLRSLILSLNGNIKLIPGDHDKSAMDVDCDGKITICDKIVEIKYKKNTIVLCHYPITYWAKSHYNSWHAHGHTHGGYSHHGKSTDVGVDAANNFTPISLKRFEEIMNWSFDNINKLKEPEKKPNSEQLSFKFKN